MHDSALCEGILTQALGSQQQVSHTLDATIHLELTGMHHCTTHLHHVTETGDDAINIDAVTIHQGEVGHGELINRVDAMLIAGLADKAHILCVGITREAAGELQHSLDAL